MENQDKTHLSETQFQKLLKDTLNNLDSQSKEIDEERRRKVEARDNNIVRILINVASNNIY